MDVRETDWRIQHGAILRTRQARLPPILAAVRSLGRTEVSVGEAATLVRIYSGPEQVAIVAGFSPAEARAVAARSGLRMRGFAVTVTYAEGRRPACTMVQSAFEVAERRFADLDLSLDDFDDEALDTDHPWRVTEAALDEVASRWALVLRDPSIQLGLAPPPSLGSPRLDAILDAVRTAAEVRVFPDHLEIRAPDRSLQHSYLPPEGIDALKPWLP